MIMHTFHPISLEHMDQPAYVEMIIGGRTVMVEEINGAQYRVVRLISTDPADFLLPEWQPGAVVDRNSGNRS